MGPILFVQSEVAISKAYKIKIHDWTGQQICVKGEVKHKRSVSIMTVIPAGEAKHPETELNTGK